MKKKIGKNIMACVVILMAMIPGVSALIPADYPEPSYITQRPGDDGMIAVKINSMLLCGQ